MPHAPHPLKIALCFDFDDTLCEESTTAFLRYAGIDPVVFWKETQAKINQGSDLILAYMNRMIELSKTNSLISRKEMLSFGEKIRFFPGVSHFFTKIRRWAQTLPLKVDVRFYLISSGLEPILSASKIAPAFEAIFASDFEWNSSKKGTPLLPGRAVSFTDKTRFLFAISKGIPPKEYYKNPLRVNEKILENQYDIPFKRMIYIGDGFSDIPCFSLLKKSGGYGIGVYKPHKLETALRLVSDERVHFTAEADYRDKGTIFKLVQTYIQKMCEN